MTIFEQDISNSLNLCEDARKTSMTLRYKCLRLLNPISPNLMVGGFLTFAFTCSFMTSALVVFGWGVVASVHLSAISLYAAVTCVAEHYRRKSLKSGLVVGTDISLQEQVAIIQSCQKLGATAKQVEMLKELAQRTDIPSDWWRGLIECIDREQANQMHLNNLKQKQKDLDFIASVSVAGPEKIFTDNAIAQPKTIMKL